VRETRTEEPEGVRGPEQDDLGVGVPDGLGDAGRGVGGGPQEALGLPEHPVRRRRVERLGAVPVGAEHAHALAGRCFTSASRVRWMPPTLGG
jgi:hypothetical protein